MLAVAFLAVWQAPAAHAQGVTPLQKGRPATGLSIADTSGPVGWQISGVNDECSASDGVCVYEHPGYGGRWVRFVGSGCYANFNDIGFNDITSALRFGGSYAGRYNAVLYEHTNYVGVSSQFNFDDPDLSNDAIGDNRASSICVNPAPATTDCIGDGVYLYEHTGYGGACQRFTSNVDNLMSTGFNDIASSIRLVGSFSGGGTRVTLCDNASFGGACSQFTGDDPDLRDDTVGNDRTSSVAIAPNSTACPAITDWRGQYWNNTTLTGTPVLCRNDIAVTFNWGLGGPGGGVNNDFFSARWTRDQNFAGGTYRFHLSGDDGVRLWIDNVLVIDQWQIQSRTEYTVDRSLSAGTHNLRVEYFENNGEANAALWWDQLTAGLCPAITDWKGEYWNNTTLAGAPVLCRNDTNVNFNWGLGGPGSGVNNDYFSARWTRNSTFNGGTYRFYLSGDDGVRLWVNNTLVIDEWRVQSFSQFKQDIYLNPGTYTLKVEYFENTGDASATLAWEQVGGSACPAITDWKGEYWNNMTLSGSPVLCRNDVAVNFNWGAGGPGGGVPSNNFSARWTRSLNFAQGRYRFHVASDDGVRLWVDGVLIIDQWKDQARTEYTVERDLVVGNHSLRIDYYENVGDANMAFWWDQMSTGCAAYRAEYFNNQQLSGTPAFVTCEPAPIVHNWGIYGPGNGIGNDNFSARWTGRFHFNAGNYTFTARTDDGMRVWLNGGLLIDQWRVQAAAEYRVSRTLADGDYDVRVEYFEATGDAVAQFGWAQATTASGVVTSNKPAFDTCRLPTPAEMQEWWNASPYYEANLYLGGISRACNDWNQQNLTTSWVQAVHNQGWNFIPTWVGPQAPCNTNGFAAMSWDANTATNQGRAEADAAVNAARNVGLTALGGGKTVIYYSLAPYPNDATCRNTVKQFMSGWVGRLRELGMRSGGYGASCGSYVSDWATIANVPDNAWPATANWPRYDPSVTVWSVGSCVPNTLWTNNQRIFQYTLGHTEWWGNAGLNINSDIAGGDVAGTHTRTAAAAAAGMMQGPKSAGLLDAQLVSGDQGWALMDDRLLWSADGGNGWSDITPAGISNAAMRAAQFVDPQNGWLVLNGQLNGGPAGLLVARTTDGGRTWWTAPLAADGLGGDAELGNVSLSFVDPANGFLSVQQASGSAFSLASLYATHDGGATWAPQTVPVAGPIRFVDAATGWVAGGAAGDELYVTHDGGATWQTQPGLPRAEKDSGVYLYGLPAFSNAGQGVIPVTVADAARPRIEFYTTTDRGASWQPASEVALARQPGAAVQAATTANGAWLAVDAGRGALQVVEPGRGASGQKELRAATAGWAIRRSGACRGDKNDPAAEVVCEQRAELVRTVDGGATWDVLRP